MRRTALQAIAVVLAPLVAPLSMWATSQRPDRQQLRVQVAAATSPGPAALPLRSRRIRELADKTPATVTPTTAPLLSEAGRTWIIAVSRSANRFQSPPPTSPAPPASPTTQPPPRVAPATPANHVAPGGAWACIRARESGNNYATNTGNGYYGAYQFSDPTWHSVGGSGHASDASPAEQDMRAQMLQARSGWGQWSTAAGCGV